MAKRNEIFPSKYLKVEDLSGEPRVARIEVAPTELLGRGDDAQEKTVLYFRGGLKPLPLNATNWDSVAAVTGADDTDDWPGHWVELYPTTTQLHGKTVPCIRIRAAPPPQKKEAPPQKPKAKAVAAAGAGNSDMDDDIPF
jgi:hypothetical protein